MDVILVNTGIFQEYINDNITQLKLFGHAVTVIVDNRFKDLIRGADCVIVTESLDIGEFHVRNQLDDAFRNGFWTNCSKWLFYLHAYMKKYNVKQCFHIENDVMVYSNLSCMGDAVDTMWVTMDSYERCIPGIIFVPDYTYLELLIQSYDYSKNDMQNLCRFFHTHPAIVKSFPIIRKNKEYVANDICSTHENMFPGIFDAAAIGQYIGGVDPQNIAGESRGFVNETCIVDYSKYSFKWLRNDSGIYIPHIVIGSDMYAIFNLHIHCKRLYEFTSINPYANSFIQRADV